MKWKNKVNKNITGKERSWRWQDGTKLRAEWGMVSLRRMDYSSVMGQAKRESVKAGMSKCGKECQIIHVRRFSTSDQYKLKLYESKRLGSVILSIRIDKGKIRTLEEKHTLKTLFSQEKTTTS